MYKWNLDVLYSGLDDPKFISDANLVKTKVSEMINLANELDEVNIETVKKVLVARNEYADLLRRQAAFLNLNMAVDSINGDYKNEFQRLLADSTKVSEANAKIDAYLSSIENLDELLTDEYISEHEFYLQEIIDSKQYQLSAKEEALISKINLNGVNTWEDLYDYVTAAHKLDYDGQKVTITEVRNLAYSPEQSVRKAAYEAELEGYKAIEASLAYSLNSIKGHVNTDVEIRGYDSPIHKTLIDSRMDEETLKAMFSAIDDSLPKFRQYLKHKGKLLGHDNGLPFYDLFAPLAKGDKQYTVEVAQAMILDSFKTFSDDLYDLTKKSFDENWIDYLPRANKRGGAFCSNLPMVKESRVMSNFGNDLSGVVTLAHELGHAYHGSRIHDHHMLNTGYVMPIAETASNMCELILSEAALKVATRNEKIELLENMISDATQVIIDIYSRFLFESSVLEERNNKFLAASDLVDIMHDAQLKTYGDGLDPNYLHGYMWACKGHYYSSNLNFYNFPYAYGALFSKGLYAKYLEEGESFVSKYDEMLTNTTVLSCENIGDMVGVNVREKEFWAQSLKMMENMIDEFIELTSEGI